MIHRKVSKHLLPHFIVEPSFLESYSEPHKLHHRAHALSLTSLSVYLVGLAVFTFGLFFLHIKAPHVLGAAAFSSGQIISITNEKRVQNGLSALSENVLLSSAASAKAGDMLANNYWAHNSPSGVTPWSFISAAGYRYVYAGENLARDFDNPGAVVDAWMNSPSHRANLLDRNFKEIGVSVSEGALGGKQGVLVVQMFGSGVSQAQEITPAAQETGQDGTEEIEEVVPAETEQVAQVPRTVLVETSVSSPASEATVLASRQFSIAKGVSFGLVAFIFILFALEVLITLRREHVKIRSGVFAHLGLLAFVLFAVWYAVQGAIL